MAHELSTDTVDNTKCYAKVRITVPQAEERFVVQPGQRYRPAQRLHNATVHVVLLCRTTEGFQDESAGLNALRVMLPLFHVKAGKQHRGS